MTQFFKIGILLISFNNSVFRYEIIHFLREIPIVLEGDVEGIIIISKIAVKQQWKQEKIMILHIFFCKLLTF